MSNSLMIAEPIIRPDDLYISVCDTRGCPQLAQSGVTPGEKTIWWTWLDLHYCQLYFMLLSRYCTHGQSPNLQALTDSDLV